MLSIRLVLVAGVASIGCGGSDDDAPAPDSGPRPTDGAAPDAGVDAVVEPPRELWFGECGSDSDCTLEGEGAFCRPAADGYPGGQCTRPCEPPDRTLCDDGTTFHHCLMEEGATTGTCEQRCLNGFDCGRAGYTCFGKGQITAGSGYCGGVCSEEHPCGPGAECNVFSGKCVAPGMVPTGRAMHGAPCTANDACMSDECLLESDGGGFLGGMCAGPCILPPGYNNNSFFAGEALPQGTCPEGSVCFPNGELARGDLGVCLPRCTSDTDCRPGYFCRLEYQVGDPPRPRSFDVGICYPITCDETTPCPTGYACDATRTCVAETTT